MLSDEEKKAIENLKDVFYQDLGKGINKFQKITLYEDSITDIRTVLNLIEKQSKEIEELKEEYSTKLLSNAGIYQLGFKDGKKSGENKIKAKIEFIKSLKEKLYYEENVISILQSLLEKE